MVLFWILTHGFRQKGFVQKTSSKAVLACHAALQSSPPSLNKKPEVLDTTRTDIVPEVKNCKLFLSFRIENKAQINSLSSTKGTLCYFKIHCSLFYWLNN